MSNKPRSKFSKKVWHGKAPGCLRLVICEHLPAPLTGCSSTNRHTIALTSHKRHNGQWVCALTLVFMEGHTVKHQCGVIRGC